MHLIGHGAVSSVLALFHLVLTDKELWTSFQNFANPIFNDIASLRIEWCSMKSLPKKNWLAEHCYIIMSGNGQICHVKENNLKRCVGCPHQSVLLCCHHFCQEYYHPSVAAVWFGKEANFVSLLNLPEQIEEDGPRGAYRDGSFERYIKRPKAGLQSVRKNPTSLQKKLGIIKT
ncbi:hypothetical protein ACHAWF_007275 [Thalassiosira exigua]